MSPFFILNKNIIHIKYIKEFNKDNFFHDKKYDEAVIEFKKVINADPLDFKTQEYLFQAHLSSAQDLLKEKKTSQNSLPKKILSNLIQWLKLSTNMSSIIICSKKI